MTDTMGLYLLITLAICYIIGIMVVVKFYPELLEHDNNDPPVYPPGY